MGLDLRYLSEISVSKDGWIAHRWPWLERAGAAAVTTSLIWPVYLPPIPQLSPPDQLSQPVPLSMCKVSSGVAYYPVLTEPQFQP